MARDNIQVRRGGLVLLVLHPHLQPLAGLRLCSWADCFDALSVAVFGQLQQARRCTEFPGQSACITDKARLFSVL